MKIAIVCYNLSWQAGGPRLIFSLAQLLKKQGHQIIIYTPEFSGKYFRELWEGLDIRVVAPRTSFIWADRSHNFFIWIWRKFLQEWLKRDTARRLALAMEADIDLLNVHDFAYPVAYFYKRRNPKVKTLWTENDPPYMYLPKENFFFDLLSQFYNNGKDLIGRRYFQAIDKVAVLDTYNERWCRERGLPAVIVRLGVDAEKFFQPVKSFIEKARQKQITLFGLGSLNKYRRYEDTITATYLLRQRGYDARAIIIANDAWKDSRYRTLLLDLIERCNLKDTVSFNFQGVSETGLREAYQQSDVFVYPLYLPPPRDGFGFSIGVFEAMAAGLPVILCRTTTSTEVLEDGQTALFVDPLAPEQIADKAQLLIDQPDRYQKIALAGQKFVKDELTWENYTKQLLALCVS